MNIGLSPLRNFGVLEEGKLYRSAQPLYPFEFEWIRERLGVGMIINLRKEARIDDRYAPKWDMTVYNIDVTDHQPPNRGMVEKFAAILKWEQPALFHCEHGHGRTSTFAVIARILQGWTLTEALDEEAKVFEYTFKHPAQLAWLKEELPSMLCVKHGI